jgi:hypothetical protein
MKKKKVILKLMFLLIVIGFMSLIWKLPIKDNMTSLAASDGYADVSITIGEGVESIRILRNSTSYTYTSSTKFTVSEGTKINIDSITLKTGYIFSYGVITGSLYGVYNDTKDYEFSYDNDDDEESMTGVPVYAYNGYGVQIQVLAKESPFYIYYNANGGTGAPSATVVSPDNESDISSTVPTRDGYTFMGWATTSSWNYNRLAYTQVKGGTTARDGTTAEISESLSITGWQNFFNTKGNAGTLYAQWEKTAYTIGTGVYAVFEDDILTIFGSGTIDKTKWNNMKSDIKEDVCEIICDDEDIYLPSDSSNMFSQLRFT